MVSIIVVCFNEVSKDIQYTLNSIIEQDYRSLELVIIDGGSRNETINALKAYNQWIFRFLSESDDGLYDAMNKGIRLASGEWVLFMNIGDRFYSKHDVSRMVGETLADTQLNMIYGDVLIEHDKKGVQHKRLPKYLRRWYLYKSMICHQAMLIRKSVFEEIGNFNTDYRVLADWEWVLRFLKKKCTYKHLERIVSVYEGGGSSSFYEPAHSEWLKLVHSYYTFSERWFYGFLWGIIKTWKRIKTRNFRIPIALKQVIRYKR